MRLKGVNKRALAAQQKRDEEYEKTIVNMKVLAHMGAVKVVIGTEAAVVSVLAVDGE